MIRKSTWDKRKENQKIVDFFFVIYHVYTSNPNKYYKYIEVVKQNSLLASAIVEFSIILYGRDLNIISYT